MTDADGTFEGAYQGKATIPIMQGIAEGSWEQSLAAGSLVAPIANAKTTPALAAGSLS